MRAMRTDGFLREKKLDTRHKSFTLELAPRLEKLPPQAQGGAGCSDLRQFTSPRHNQRNTGSCVAQSLVKALEIKRIMKHGHDEHVDLSVLFVYYLARELRGKKHTQRDNGSFVSHACKVLHKFGVPEEIYWHFDPSRVLKSPSLKSMRKGAVHRIGAYYRINETGAERVEAVKKALYNGHPVVYGTRIDSTWFRYDRTTGPLTLPKPTDLQGGHATCLVGFDGAHFIGENSWGTGWGHDGFYYMNPAVIASSTYSHDFWVITGGWEELNEEEDS